MGARDKAPVVIEHAPIEERAIGGGLEGANNTSRETLLWSPSFLSPDQTINGVKDVADARSRDMSLNDGYVAGANAIHKDNIVGTNYRLNAQPNWRVLGSDEGWAEEFQIAVESRFNVIAESRACWLDAARRNNLTAMVRLAIGSYLMSGEVLAPVEWIRDDASRPFKTAVQIISPTRLSNPNGTSDTRTLRRGVSMDNRGRPLGYYIRGAYPTETYDNQAYQWTFVPAAKPWGRVQCIHIVEQLMPAQTRGIAEMVAALKQMKMTKKFHDVVLQNAVINATYAASIESELPTDQAFEVLGGGEGAIAGMQNYIGTYMTMLGAYLDGSKNIAIDGAKIPHLFPGTKLNMKPVGTPGGVGTDFEQSLLRHIAACLGLSYEQFSRDYTKTNYSSARASMNETWKSMQGKKRLVADGFATHVYALWLEEEIALGNVPLPSGKTRDWFYEPLVKDALTMCSWIGASRGQIDEMKETQAALLRIQGGLSTYEKECSRLGDDFRDVFAQRAREERMKKQLGLEFSSDTTKPTPADGQGDSNAADAASSDIQQ